MCLPVSQSSSSVSSLSASTLATSTVWWLYEPDAVMAVSGEKLVIGGDAIRQALVELVRSGVTLTLGKQRPTLRMGDLALTSTYLDDGGVTAEVARRQADGTWRWVIDQWNVLDS
jgi:hypothetical protein